MISWQLLFVRFSFKNSCFLFNAKDDKILLHAQLESKTQTNFSRFLLKKKFQQLCLGTSCKYFHKTLTLYIIPSLITNL